MLKDVPQPLEQLRILNSERLAQLHRTPMVGVAFDVHGFTRGKDTNFNQAILHEQARLLKLGCVLIAVTGFGDRIHRFQTQPLTPYLLARGLTLKDVPFYLSTRNGALTTHAFTDEVLDAHPITPEMYGAITSHPLVRAIHALTRPEVKQRIAEEYEDTQKSLGFPLHPRRTEFSGIRYDWHPGTNAGYQLTVMYEPEHIVPLTKNDPGFHDAMYIFDTCGEIPNTPQIMAGVINRQLSEIGIFINTNTAASHAEIDIALPEVNKGLGCTAILPVIADLWNLSPHVARLHSIGGGDSPTQNDEPLIAFFKYGVTNVDYWTKGTSGPIVLDYPGVSDPVERTYELFKRIHVR